jgi:hypothetical protein
MLTKQNARLHSNKERFARRINSPSINLKDYMAEYLGYHLHEKYKSDLRQSPAMHMWIAYVDMEGIP